MPTTRHKIPLGKVMGIPIGLDYSWFLIFVLMTWILASNYYPSEYPKWNPYLYWLIGAVTTVLLFASVLLHELGHSVIALRYKVPVKSITLFLFGGIAQIETDPPSAAADFWIAITGPLVSFSLAALFFVTTPLLAGSEPLFALVKYLAYINLALGLFNLIPGYPLDGGRVLRAAVWSFTGKMHKATLIAAGAGRFFAFIFIGIGVWKIFHGDIAGGLWVAFIGWFLDNASSAEVHQISFQETLAGHKVSQAMTTECTSVPADTTLQELVEDQVLAHGHRSFLVNRGKENIGLMTLREIKEIPREKWPTMKASEAMLPLNWSKRIGPDEGLWAALQMMNREQVNEIPVIRDHQVVGLLNRKDVITFMGTVKELGPGPLEAASK